MLLLFCVVVAVVVVLVVVLVVNDYKFDECRNKEIQMKFFRRWIQSGCNGEKVRIDLYQCC